MGERDAAFPTPASLPLWLFPLLGLCLANPPPITSLPNWELLIGTPIQLQVGTKQIIIYSAEGCFASRQAPEPLGMNINQQ